MHVMIGAHEFDFKDSHEMIDFLNVVI